MSFEHAPNFNDECYYCDSEEIEVNLDEPSYMSSINLRTIPQALDDDPFQDNDDVSILDDVSPPSPLRQTSSGADIVRTAIQLTKAETLKGNAELKRRNELPSGGEKKKKSLKTKRDDETNNAFEVKTTTEAELIKPTIISTKAKPKKKVTSVPVPATVEDKSITSKKAGSRFWYYVSEDEDVEIESSNQAQKGKKKKLDDVKKEAIESSNQAQKGKKTKLDDVKKEAASTAKTFSEIGVQTSPVTFKT